MGRPSLSQDEEGTCCSSLRGSPACGGNMGDCLRPRLSEHRRILVETLRQAWDPVQRDAVSLIQTRSFPFPRISSPVVLFCLLQMARTPPPFPPQTLTTVQGPASGSPATQPLTHPHGTLGLSMGGPSRPHRSSLSPTSLRMIVEPIPASPLTLALASRRPQSRLSQSLVSGPLEHLH